MARPETEKMFKSQQEMFRMTRNFCCPHCKKVIAKPDAVDLAADELMYKISSAEEANRASGNVMITMLNLLQVAGGGFEEAMTREEGDAFPCPQCRRKLSLARAWANLYPAVRSGGCALVIAVVLILPAVVGRLTAG